MILNDQGTDSFINSRVKWLNKACTKYECHLWSKLFQFNDYLETEIRNDQDNCMIVHLYYWPGTDDLISTKVIQGK